MDLQRLREVLSGGFIRAAAKWNGTFRGQRLGACTQAWQGRAGQNEEQGSRHATPCFAGVLMGCFT